ncbi:MAG: N-formylglutamate amidohydrolase [Arenibacterium sp.]
MKRSLLMPDALNDSDYGPAVAVQPAPDAAEILLVCEHGSHWMPPALGNLGLPDHLLTSHIAWDPGALGVAKALAAQLGAPLVHGLVSRLVYDCNRPPEVASSVPAKSESHEVPGNCALNDAARRDRIQRVYTPFRNRLRAEIGKRKAMLRLLVTVHSFTPVFHGQKRSVELGLLHGKDDRFARAMLSNIPATLSRDVRLNEPYSTVDGVAHTLDEHGAKNDLLNVMLEIRNDLITTEAAQSNWAKWLAPWIRDTLQKVAS